MTVRWPFNLTTLLLGRFRLGSRAAIAFFLCYIVSIQLFADDKRGRQSNTPAPESTQHFVDISDPEALKAFLDEQGIQSVGGVIDTKMGPSVAEVTQAAEQAIKEGVEGTYKATAEFSSLARAIESIEGLGANDAETMSQEIESLFYKLVNHGRSEEKRLEPKQFKEDLLMNKILVTERPESSSKESRAELNLVDGVKFQRILHGDSEISFAFIPMDKVEENSKHESRIIGSQHLIAGRSRADGQTGRDAVNIYYRWGPDGKIQIDRIRYFQRHSTWSLGWWKDQMLISLYKPSREDILISGLFWGMTQVGLTALVQHLSETWAHHPMPINQNQVIFTGCFGATCGIFATSIRKFNQIGGRLENLVRNSLTTTIPFLVPYTLMDPNRNLSHLHEILLFIAVEIPVFCLLSNLPKLPMQRLVKDRSDRGLTRDKTFLGVKLGNWEYQGLYNFLVFPSRIAFLKSTGGLKLKQYLGFNLGWSKLFLPGLYPLLWQAQISYSEKIGVEEAPKNRKAFEKSIFGATTGLFFGSLYNIALAPIAEIRQRVRGGTESDENRYLENLKSKWNLQNEAPAYHFGRLVEFLSGALQLEEKESSPEVQYRFTRTKASEFPPAELTFVTKAWRQMREGSAAKFLDLKNKINEVSGGKLGRCQKTLAQLSARMKAPFEMRLASFKLK